jgi:hypothetical protein
MSFNYHARRVRDGGRPPWRRLSDLRACVSSYCWLTGAGYRRMLEYLQLDHSPEVPRDPPTDEFLRRTLDEVERERSRYLERLRGFERKRIRAKMRGNRQLSAAERAVLREMRGGVG